MVGVRSSKKGGDTGIGQRLSSARIRHGISLQEVSETIRIPAKQLRALEDENYSAFSAELYARGAYTTYARYLGVYNPKDLRLVLRSLSAVRERVPLRMLSPDKLFDRMLHPHSILFIAVGCLALLIGGYIAWQLQSFWKVPDLIITSPVNHVLQEASVRVAGTSERNVRLSMNGEQVLLHQDASFSQNITLHKGINMVNVEVINASGRTNSKKLFLLREK